MNLFVAPKSSGIKSITFAAIMALVPSCFTDFSAENAHLRQENADLRAKIQKCEDELKFKTELICETRAFGLWLSCFPPANTEAQDYCDYLVNSNDFEPCEQNKTNFIQ